MTKKTRIGRICNSPVYKKGNMIISTCFNCKCDVALDSCKITSDNKIICINCQNLKIVKEKCRYLLGYIK